MSFVVVIIAVALFCFLIYGIAKLVAVITGFFKIQWAVLIASYVGIIVFLRQYSILNYAVIAISIIIFGRLLISQVSVIAQTTGGSKRFDKVEYRDALKKAYASNYAFIIFGSLYANLNYLLAVQVGGMTMEEYKDMSFLTGKALSLIGFGPIRWGALIIAAIFAFLAFHHASDFDINCRITDVPQTPESTVDSYFNSVLGIPLKGAMQTLEATKAALLDYFSPKVDAEVAPKLVDAILNVASFELTDKAEILETLTEDSGLSQSEIEAVLPVLKKG